MTCQCWKQSRLTGHEGHCCFGDGWDDIDTVVCGHLSEGLVLFEEWARLAGQRGSA